MERRACATLERQWPDAATAMTVTSPQLGFKDYCAFTAHRQYKTTINLMVGDLQRIIEYPKRDLQTSQIIPGDVMSAFWQLVEAGYDKHLIK